MKKATGWIVLVVVLVLVWWAWWYMDTQNQWGEEVIFEAQTFVDEVSVEHGALVEETDTFTVYEHEIIPKWWNILESDSDGVIALINWDGWYKCSPVKCNESCTEWPTSSWWKKCDCDSQTGTCEYKKATSSAKKVEETLSTFEFGEIFNRNGKEVLKLNPGLVFEENNWDYVVYNENDGTMFISSNGDNSFSRCKCNIHDTSDKSPVCTTNLSKDRTEIECNKNECDGNCKMTTVHGILALDSNWLWLSE